MTINVSKPSLKLAWSSNVPDQLSETNTCSEKKAYDIRFKELVEATMVSKRSGQDVKGFAESTTAHGLKYAFSEESSRFRRMAWFLAFIAALTYLSYQLISVSIDYYRFPMKAENRLTRMESLAFPTVTICNLNHADSSKTDDPAAITDIYRVAKGCMWSEIMNMSLSDMKNNETYRPYLEQRYMNIVKQVAWDVEDMFKFCMWNGKAISCDEILSPYWTLNGKCFKLNGNYSNPLVATGSGLGGGFFAAMKTSLEGHTFSDEGLYGFKLLLHHMYDAPDVYSKGFVVSPGFGYHFSFVAETIKYLPYPFKSQDDMYCSDYPLPSKDKMRKKSFDYGPYSLTACITHKAKVETSRLCGCDIKNCTLYEHLNCFGPNFKRIYDDATKTDLLGCSIPCTLRSYRPVISQAAYPSPELSDMMNRMKKNETYMNSDSKSEHLGLSLFFEDLILRELVHKPVYNSLSFLGVLGGNMGLLLGASILTVAELFEFIMLLLWGLFNKNKENPAIKPQ